MSKQNLSSDRVSAALNPAIGVAIVRPDPAEASPQRLGLFASPTVVEHLCRGVGAVLLIAVALATLRAGPFWWTPVVLIASGGGALFLLRGCPMCWTIGLLETVGHRLSRKAARRLS